MFCLRILQQIKWLIVAEPVTLVPKSKVSVLCRTEDAVYILEVMKNKHGSLEQGYLYEVVFNIFWTDTVKITKLTISPVGCRHPQSSLPHVDTGLTATSIFGTLTRSPFPLVSRTLQFSLDLLNGIKPASFQLQFHFWK
jgi:hypothetical protein